VATTRRNPTAAMSDLTGSVERAGRLSCALTTPSEADEDKLLRD
jgi:hypothetical protein